jgi:3-phenylpropionate/trans-cinnamate dioxygenase ferredoxin reductase subunit
VIGETAGIGTHAGIVMIGGGFIGMETTASLRRRGLEVTQVEFGDALYASLQAPPLSASLERLYRERGVEVILGDVVAEFRGSDGKLTGAVTRAGREIEAELAIIGVGVQPSTSYLEGCGVELDRGTVLVDERFATNVPGIYAVGDIANFSDPIFGHRRLIQRLRRICTSALPSAAASASCGRASTRPTHMSRSSSRRCSAPRSASSEISTAATTSSSCAARSSRAR